MMTARISPENWRDLGITQWITRPGFQTVSAEEAVQTVQAQSEIGAGQAEQADQTDAIQPSEESLVNQPKTQRPSWVLIGAGLASIWQKDNDQAWLLWNNIIHYHLDSVEQVLFYDTDQILSEDAGFDVIEELIEREIETVFSMDPEHELHQQLAESINLITLPSFEQMLEQPQLKRHTFIELQHNLST